MPVPFIPSAVGQITFLTQNITLHAVLLNYFDDKIQMWGNIDDFIVKASLTHLTQLNNKRFDPESQYNEKALT